MSEWLNMGALLAVPLAAVALMGWWHERRSHRDLDEWLKLLQEEYGKVRTMNEQLRSELNRVDHENKDLRAALFNKKVSS